MLNHKLQDSLLPPSASGSPSAILRPWPQPGPVALPGAQPVGWREALKAESTSRLALFLLGLACCLALICLYLWQASTISSIDAGTAQMERQLDALEHESTALMVQLAQWNAPSFIESKILELGMKAGPSPIYVHVGDAAGAAATLDAGAGLRPALFAGPLPAAAAAAAGRGFELPSLLLAALQKR